MKGQQNLIFDFTKPYNKLPEDMQEILWKDTFCVWVTLQTLE